MVEGADRRVVALEVKLAADVTNSDVRHLTWLRERLGDRLADAAVITTGHHCLSPPRWHRCHPRIANRTVAAVRLFDESPGSQDDRNY